ncbi:MAG: TRAP transporter substrate-binding protein [Tropicimonas sp.]|uniref:TRAP transporter substrate-binding protein n=1 Tax=Tropicimonas sp. TaxID=2067044 RepID=UPI003A852A51
MTSRMTFRFGLVFAAAAMVFSAAASAETVIKVGTGISEAHYQYKALQEFEAYVEAQSGGELQVEIYPNAMLGSDLEILEAIKLGTVHMNVPTPSVLGNFVKEFRIPDLPYIFPNAEIANRVADSEWAADLLARLEPVGFKGLAIGDFGKRHITNDVRPIESLDDLKGMKIRVMQNPVILEVFRSLGTNPTPMGFGEVFSALQMGTIDGQENPYATILLSRFYEVQKYLSNSGHMHSWDVLHIGKPFFDRLTPEQQQIVQDGAKVFAASERKASQEAEAAALQELIDAGVTYTEISPENLAQMRAAAMPTVEKFGNEINAEMFGELTALIEEYSKE